MSILFSLSRKARVGAAARSTPARRGAAAQPRAPGELGQLDRAGAATTTSAVAGTTGTPWNFGILRHLQRAAVDDAELHLRLLRPAGPGTGPRRGGDLTRGRVWASNSRRGSASPAPSTGAQICCDGPGRLVRGDECVPVLRVGLILKTTLAVCWNRYESASFYWYSGAPTVPVPPNWPAMPWSASCRVSSVPGSIDDHRLHRPARLKGMGLYVRNHLKWLANELPVMSSTDAGAWAGWVGPVR